MTETMDDLGTAVTNALQQAANLIRTRGHDRNIERGHHAAPDGPLSIQAAIDIACHDMPPSQWHKAWTQVRLYWHTLPADHHHTPWDWERRNRDRDATADAANHLDAAAEYRH